MNITRREVAVASVALGALTVACDAPQTAQRANTVNDITQLNPIRVARVAAPASVDELSALIAAHPGPISIGGARFSQGGQIATDDALFIDMRKLNRVVAIDAAARTIQVQAGATWREIMEAIDPLNLSPKIMQSFFNFTVGGSLSVNCHGDYPGLGPIVDSVRSVRMVMADGAALTASRDENRELFQAAIGGYGGVGAITEATLDLTENVRVERTVHRMTLDGYVEWHRANVLGHPDIVLHHAVLYPGAYQSIVAEVSTRTDKPLTVQNRLAPAGTPSSFDRLLIDVAASSPMVHSWREHVYDPLTPSETSVAWRNYEAAGDAYSLEPRSRARSTFVLQEYFVPASGFEAFARNMGRILNARGANILNVAIRHTRADQETLLAWARNDVYSFVLYHEQGTDQSAKDAVRVWTRALIDAALAEGGSYYLPYQVHATREQFLAAYPRTTEFFEAKQRFDPAYKFRNRLWDAYYRA